MAYMVVLMFDRVFFRVLSDRVLSSVLGPWVLSRILGPRISGMLCGISCTNNLTGLVSILCFKHFSGIRCVDSYLGKFHVITGNLDKYLTRE